MSALRKKLQSLNKQWVAIEQKLKYNLKRHELEVGVQQRQLAEASNQLAQASYHLAKSNRNVSNIIMVSRSTEIMLADEIET
ncbi:hypothetical protein PV08_01233 [Exophiala spinifera]|uniref:Uncharacterized protein n=1 Tax=Exophiala spinifera TaxID=91928 RepID=A0A0D1YZC9_9EURO|nr:uncharacterized protein PV08_01233 [Exophiala spinifera]KIW20656.1 hypothetical protein PV08_01233 [Exophiala spinifera]